MLTYSYSCACEHNIMALEYIYLHFVFYPLLYKGNKTKKIILLIIDHLFLGSKINIDTW